MTDLVSKDTKVQNVQAVMASSAANKSLVGDIASAAVNQALQSGILNDLIKGLEGALVKLISGLFTKRAGSPPISTPQVPNPIRLPDDDNIQAPVGAVPVKTIGSAVLKLQKAQYSASLFPDMYTEANPQGLYQDIQQFEGGKSALNRMSKFWMDITASNVDGNEMGGDELKKNGLAFVTEFVVTDESGKITRITGKGVDATGKPNSWEQEENTFVGLGITSWLNSLGFNEQMKAFGEGKVTIAASVGLGVNKTMTNSVVLRFS